MPAATASNSASAELLCKTTRPVMLAALCFAAIEWPARGALSPWVWGAALLTLAAGALFVLAERRARAPLVPLAWLGHRTLGAVNGVGFLLNFGYYGALFVLSLHLQNVEHLSARQTGLVMLPMAVSLSAGNIFAGKLMARFSTPAMMLGGLVIGAAGLLATSAALTGHVHLWVVSATMVAYGGGTALAIAPMTSTILSAAPGELAGTASGLLNAARQTGSLLGVAAAGAVVAVVPCRGRCCRSWCRRCSSRRRRTRRRCCSRQRRRSCDLTCRCAGGLFVCTSISPGVAHFPPKPKRF